MTRLRLSRIFWIGAAAILIVAALIAVSAILRGDFGETATKILGTLLSLLVAGATAVSGLALVERRVLVPFGWAAVVGAGSCFALQAAAIWDEFSSESLYQWAGSSIALMLALLLLTTQRLLLGERRLVSLFYGTAVMGSIGTALTFFAIWHEDNGGQDGIWQAAAVFWILAALGYLLLPVVQRFTTAGAPTADVRVLGVLDGVELVAARGRVEGVAVESPAPGERLVLRPRS